MRHMYRGVCSMRHMSKLPSPIDMQLTSLKAGLVSTLSRASLPEVTLSMADITLMKALNT